MFRDKDSTRWGSTTSTKWHTLRPALVITAGELEIIVAEPLTQIELPSKVVCADLGELCHNEPSHPVGGCCCCCSTYPPT